jgi:hyperosmotically inducible protein
MKPTSIKSLLVVLALVTVAAGCQSMTGKTAGQNVDDASLTASVKAKLVADKAANLTRVNVETDKAVVSLGGVVETAEQRARDVKGVQRVVNNLQIEKR